MDNAVSRRGLLPTEASLNLARMLLLAAPLAAILEYPLARHRIAGVKRLLRLFGMSTKGSQTMLLADDAHVKGLTT